MDVGITRYHLVSLALLRRSSCLTKNRMTSFHWLTLVDLPSRHDEIEEIISLNTMYQKESCQSCNKSDKNPIKVTHCEFLRSFSVCFCRPSLTQSVAYLDLENQQPAKHGKLYRSSTCEVSFDRSAPNLRITLAFGGSRTPWQKLVQFLAGIPPCPSPSPFFSTFRSLILSCLYPVCSVSFHLSTFLHLNSCSFIETEAESSGLTFFKGQENRSPQIRHIQGGCVNFFFHSGAKPGVAKQHEVEVLCCQLGTPILWQTNSVNPRLFGAWPCSGCKSLQKLQGLAWRMTNIRSKEASKQATLWHCRGQECT